MKRFTETTKWDDVWFRSLTGIEKLVFLYVLDRCNNAGFWEIDEHAAVFQTGLSKPQFLGAIEGLNRGLICKGGWVWIRRFLVHQKNDTLNAENNAHKQIIRLITEQVARFTGVAEFDQFLGAIQGLVSPIGTGKGKGTGGEGGEKSPEWMPESLREDEHFPKVWEAFCEHRKEGGNTLTRPAKRGLLSKLERYGAEVATEALDEAITNGWKNPVMPDERNHKRIPATSDL